MANRRTTRSGSPATPEPRPLVETNGALGIKLMEAQFAKIEKLDPADRDAILDAQRYLLGDVKRVFGAESEEYTQVWQNDIISESILLGTLGGEDDDFDEGSWGKANKLMTVKTNIDKMVARLRRLVVRAKELAALHGEQGGEPMNPFKVFEEQFQLIKPSGERHPGRGIWANDVVTVHNARFPVAIGDAVERTLPNGIVENREVANVRFEKGVRPIPDAYHLDLRNASVRPTVQPVVNHNTTYNIHGVAGAVGQNASVTNSNVIGQAAQWNGVDRDQLAAELGKLRGALLSEAGEDDDAAAELGPVGEANKALKAGDEPGFMGALKRFGKKTLALGESLSLAALDHYMRHRLGLPPAGGT